MAFVYPTVQHAVDIHKKTVEVSGGGSTGSLDLKKLESVLVHIQNDDYYPTFEDKLTHLFFCSNKFHCFEDGNKRIAIALGAHFLILNGYVFVSSRFIHEMENISYHVAAGSIDKEFLKEIITAVINDAMDNEELKLKLYNAMDNEILSKDE